MKKKLFLSLFFLSFISFFSEAQNDVPVVERFALEEDSLYSLKAAMYLPNGNKFDKIVIFLTSVWYDPNLDFMSLNPYVKNLIRFMNDNKTGVLLMSRDSCLKVEENRRLMHIETMVSDAEKAVEYLKNSKNTVKPLLAFGEQVKPDVQLRW